VAALWSWRAVRRGAFALTLSLLPACSELALPSEAGPPPAEPPYASLAAKYFQSAFKDRTAYDDFEISGLRWVHSIKGWGWLACVHFLDHGHRRTYALLIQDNVVADGRYAVETDTCEAQSFTQFDVATGVLGRPTTPAQPALY
jgi:hypothetical protein